MLNRIFTKLSARVSSLMGSSYAFLVALSVVVVWAMTGPMFGYSNTWQLVINTGTTIVTFLMVFLIQNTQNRDSKAMQLKLDELIRTSKGARNFFVELESLTDKELEALSAEFQKVHDKHVSKLTEVLSHQLQAEKARRHGYTSLVNGMGTVIHKVKDFGNKEL